MTKQIKDILGELIFEAAKVLDIEVDQEDMVLDHPADMQFGDYSCNIALKLGQKQNRNPKEFATDLVAQIAKQNNEYVDKVEVAGPGFLNFYLKSDFFINEISKILVEADDYGRGDFSAGKKVIVEYTDPNPFKLFHIGHLMTNVIGESISRLYDFSGAEVKRACYQGDVGMHVAKTIWGILHLEKDMPKAGTLSEKVEYLGQAYAFGSKQGKDNETVKKEQQIINKKVYERTDEKINEIYDLGRIWSLDYFETVYLRLGTEHNSKEGKAFDFYFFESEIAGFGKELVLEWIEKGVFVKSDGAVVFQGEQYGMHTRVFINSEGLPTYEAKEMGLSKIKYDNFPYDLSIIVTGNEINDYFKVLLKVISLIFPELSLKTKHLGHGMLRLPTGKMSSRTGDVIVAEYIIDQSKEAILVKMKESEHDVPDINKTSDEIAVGAIKYSILRQDIGKDVIFDFDKSLSFTGNSGPYLQYTFARTQSILTKAEKEGIKPTVSVFDEITTVEKLLYRFPEIVERACQEYAPHHIATYLYELASAFSSYYVDHQVVSREDNSPYRVALTSAVGQVLKNGLNLLGIKAPQKM